MEPASSKMTLKVYRNDIEICSSALVESGVKQRRLPEIWEWDDSSEWYYEAKEAGFPDDMLRGRWLFERRVLGVVSEKRSNTSLGYHVSG